MTEPRLVEVRPKNGLCRVGYAIGPYWWGRGDARQLASPTEGNRFDSQRGDYGVMYFGTQLTCCFGEALQQFRADTDMLQVVKEEWAEKNFTMCGIVSADWRHKRTIVTATITDPRPFVDVEHPHTHQFLTERMPVILSTLGVKHLDVATIRGDDRRVTRSISQWIHDQADGHGIGRYAGVRFLSHIDSSWECWALFEDSIFEPGPTRRSITLSTPALQPIKSLYRLVVY